MRESQDKYKCNDIILYIFYSLFSPRIHKELNLYKISAAHHRDKLKHTASSINFKSCHIQYILFIENINYVVVPWWIIVIQLQCNVANVKAYISASFFFKWTVVMQIHLILDNLLVGIDADPLFNITVKKYETHIYVNSQRSASNIRTLVYNTNNAADYFPTCKKDTFSSSPILSI